MGWEEPQFDYGIQSVGKGGGKGNGSCHNCGQLGHWPRECPSNPKGGDKGKVLLSKVMEIARAKVGLGQTNLVKVRGKVGGTKVHVSTVAKLDIKRQNGLAHGRLRFLKSQKRLLGVLT